LVDSAEQRDRERVRSLSDRLFAELPDFPESNLKKARRVPVGGEDLVAIENLTTQLYEFDIPIGRHLRMSSGTPCGKPRLIRISRGSSEAFLAPGSRLSVGRLRLCVSVPGVVTPFSKRPAGSFLLGSSSAQA
jgi:hypothetical protein